MSTELKPSKTGLRLVFDVSAQPSPRISGAYPIPDIPVATATMLTVALEPVAQTGRSGIRVTSRVSTLPGGPGAVWSLIHTVVQGAIAGTDGIPVAGTAVNILLDSPIPGATHGFALRRVDAGQVTTWPASTISTPADPTQGDIQDAAAAAVAAALLARQSGNLIKNGNSEMDAPTGAEASGVLSGYPASAHSGIRFRITANESGAALDGYGPWIYWTPGDGVGGAPLPCIPGDRIYFEVWARCLSGSVTGILAISWRNVSNGEISSGILELPLGPIYGKFAITSVAPAGASSMILVTGSKNLPAGGEIWYDDAYAERSQQAAIDAHAAADTAQAAADAAHAYAAAQRALAETTAAAYADGIVTAEEARAIADATTKANAAQAAAIAAAAADATAKANAAQAAADAYTAAQRALAETTAAAYADGIVSAEEARAIADALARYNAAAALAATAQAAATNAALLARDNNLIKNGNSEMANPTGYEAAGVVPTSDGPTGSTRVRRVTSVAAGDTDLYVGETPCTEGEQLTFEAQARTPYGVGRAFVYIYWINAAGGVFGGAGEDVEISNPSWGGKAKAKGTAPAGTVSAKFLLMYYGATAAGQWAEFDSLYAERSQQAAIDAHAAADIAQAAADAAHAYAAAQRALAETTAAAYADGIVTAEEARAIADATAKANAAQAAAITAAAADATAKANAAQAAALAAAQAYTAAQRTLAETTAAAYADGIVTAEEARAIADATTKANAAQAAAISAAAADAIAKANAAQAAAIAAANAYTAAQRALAETTAAAYADGIVSAEEARAIADALARYNAAAALAATAQAAATTAALLARDNNLIKNGNSEMANPTGYEAAGVVPTSDGPTGSTRVRRITAVAAGDTDLYVGETPCTEGEQLTFEAQARTPYGVGRAFVYIYWINAAGGVFGGAGGDVAISNASWGGKAKAKGTAPAGTVSAKFILMYYGATAAGQWAEFDSLYAERSQQAAIDAHAAADIAQAAADAAHAYAAAQRALAETTAAAYADGIVTAEEARAIADATAKANAAQAAAISAAAADATAKANAAQAAAIAAADAYTAAQRALAETTATAYADGIVTAAESRAIADATAKANAAQAAAIAAAAADATAKANAAQASAAALAADAQYTADGANALLATIADDNILSPGEKPAIILDKAAIDAEQSGIDAQATAYGITTEKTAYDSAVAALTAYLATLTSPTLWSNTAWNTTIVGGTFRTNFASVYTTRQALLNAIYAKAKALADAAQGTATAASASAAYADILARSPNNLIKNGNSELGAGAKAGSPEADHLMNAPSAARNGNWIRLIANYSGSNRTGYGEWISWTGLIPCSEADQFYFEFFARKLTAAAGTVVLAASWRNAAGSEISNVLINTTLTTTYQKISSTLTAPTGAVGIVFVTSDWATPNNQEIWFDDAYACRKLSTGMLQGDAIQTANYSEAAGVPTAGARMDISGSSLKVHKDGLQIGATVFSEYLMSRITQGLDGTTALGRICYRGSVDPTTRSGAPNITCLSVTRRRWDTTNHIGRLELSIQPSSSGASDNLDAMRYAKIQLLRQSAAGTTATVTAVDTYFLPLADRSYFSFSSDTNTGNASIFTFETVDSLISSGFPAALVTLYNAYGPSAGNCFYAATANADGSALTNSGTTWPGGITGGSSGGSGGGGGGGGGACPAPWVRITLASGLLVDAGDLYDGARVIGVNDCTMEPTIGTVRSPRITFEPRAAVVLEDGRAPEFSLPHRLAVEDRGWVEVRHLRPGDSLVGQSLSIVKAIVPRGLAQVIQFQVEGCHTYLSDGLLSHNVKLLN